MSAEQRSMHQATDQLYYFDPSEVLVDEAVDVRFSQEFPDTEEEIAAIQDVARSILQVGQLQPARVRFDAEGRPHLTHGTRRRKAIQVINMGRGEGEEPYRLAAVAEVESEGTKPILALQQAAHENIQRRGLSPMQLARLCERTRQVLGWVGKNHTKDVAAWLGVSDATVTQHEKFLTLPKHEQSLLHSGVLSAQAALDLVELMKKGASEDEVHETVEEARVEQERLERRVEVEEGERRAEEAVGGGVEGGKKKGRKKQAAAKKAARATGKVQRKQVRQAAAKKGLKGATYKKTLPEVVEWWAGVGKDAKNPLGQFARAVVVWMNGKLNDAGLKTAMEAAVAGIRKGVAAGAGKAGKATVVTGAQGKTVNRSTTKKKS